MTKIISTLFIVMLSIGLHAQKIYDPTAPIVAAVVDDIVSYSKNEFLQPQIQRGKDVLGPYIAAQTTLTNLTESDLVWQMNSNDTWIGTLTIAVEKAQNINALFTIINWPSGAKLFLMGNNSINGPYTSQSFTSSSFSHFPVDGNKLQVHIELTNESKDDLQFKISEVNAAFNENMLDGNCNIPSICPEANAYRLAQKSTVIISTNGVGFCTGTLINNTSRDDTPLILTAEHCLPFNRNISNWVIGFNYEAKFCDSANVSNGKSFSLRGADVIAANTRSDFALIELRESLGPNDSTHFAGWDKSDISPSLQYAFHHPNGALKRFSLNSNNLEKTIFLGSEAWKVDKWEIGTTEGGSSGGSLMNSKGHVIGTLIGGNASCANINSPDHYGRIAVGFEDNIETNKTLAPWLDPNFGNYDTLAGYDYPRSNIPNIDLSIRKINGLNSNSCDGVFEPEITVKNVGAQSVSNYTLSIQSAGMPNWLPNESIATIAPGQSITYTFSERTYPFGTANFDINLNTENDAYPKNNLGYKQSIVLENSVDIQMLVKLDDYGNENYWELYNTDNERINGDGPFKSGASGSIVEQNFCLEEGCYRLEFTDRYGDGMCCDYGDGNFILIASGNDTLATGYNGPLNTTGDSETQIVNFCITANSIKNQEKLSLLSIAPNPVSMGQIVTFHNTNKPTPFELLSLDGKTLQSAVGSSLRAPSKPGVYLIKAEGYSIQRLLVY